MKDDLSGGRVPMVPGWRDPDDPPFHIEEAVITPPPPIGPSLLARVAKRREAAAASGIYKDTALMDDIIEVLTS